MLTGITNVQEFYSAHYLDELFSKDIKDIRKTWKEREETSMEKAPPSLLLSYANKWFKHKRTIVEARSSSRDQHTEAYHLEILNLLGYQPKPQMIPAEDDNHIGLLHSETNEGMPHLWVLQAHCPQEGDTLLDQELLYPQELALEKPPKLPITRAISACFRQTKAPRWVLVLAGSEFLLTQADKWGRGRYLLFHCDAIFGARKKDETLATAIFLAKETLCPNSGELLHDALEENSHKHAFGVSSDLKDGIRHAVELMANAWLADRRKREIPPFGDSEWRRSKLEQKQKGYWFRIHKDQVYDANLSPAEKQDLLVAQLTREAMRYAYRLLFLFYVESRGEDLGVIPLRSSVYKQGYSLELLRDLEQTPLDAKTRDGSFFHQSIKQLFHLIRFGHGDDTLSSHGMFLPGLL